MKGYEKPTRTAKREVWRKAKGRCAICGGRIDRSLAGDHPMAFSLDHVTPQSRGGSFGKQNLRATHRICNMHRGAADALAQDKEGEGS